MLGRVGLYRWLLPRRWLDPPTFDLSHGLVPLSGPWPDPAVIAEADELLAGRMNYFSAHLHAIGNPPNWFLNPFLNKEHPQSASHWSKISDHHADLGDIKTIWEASRCTWALTYARAWRVSGDARYLSALQNWVQNWTHHNPPNTGPNWKCGQETAIRLINILLALQLAELNGSGASGLSGFVEAHCRRVSRTTFYAVAQDNNHATSEAAGLFVGGTWLSRHGDGSARRCGERWAAKGRTLLERCVRRLVLPDGSFSQHSLTYHRLLLDTLSVAEAWRRSTQEAPFSKAFYQRAAVASQWFGAMLDPESGDGPNLGANDGAHPYPLASGAYRDFRPSLQLASLLFIGRPALGPGPWDEPAAWLGVTIAAPEEPWLRHVKSTVFPDGGYVVMRDGSRVRVILRTPTARFRPAQADALHLDAWWQSTNLLRDGGTYGYLGGGEIADVLKGVAGHNTVQFDDRDQMPRLGPFLYGAWLRVRGAAAVIKTGDAQSWVGSYIDRWGARHERMVTLNANILSVRDHVQGFKHKAVLRWHLAPGDWSLEAGQCASPVARIRVEATVPIRRMSLESGWESRHYLEKTAVPVLEVEIGEAPAILTTTVAMV